MAKKLNKHHRQELAGSGIGADVIAARGYETVKERARLLEFEYEPFQWTGPGLLIPIKDAHGQVVGSQWKADKPRTEDVKGDDGEVTKTKARKYDNPNGSRVRLDVPVGAAAGLADRSVPLWITEGAKKADAAVTAGLCCVSVLGVWNWKSDGEPLQDWDHIKLDGREVFIAYDSDVMKKPEVQGALDALTAFLAERGARVAWVLLPDRPSLAGENAKVGLDDWLVDNNMDASGLSEYVREPEINIKVNNAELKMLTRQAISALKAGNVPPRLFSRNGTFMEARPIGLMEIDKDRLKFLLSEFANWYKSTDKGRTPVSPPSEVVTNVLAAGQELWGLERVERVVTTPVFAADGTLRTEPGYHGPSRSFYIPPEGLVIPTVKAEPTKKDVKTAKSLINRIFEGFEFVGAADRAHAWALLLQPFAREIIRGNTPLYSVQAPRQGTGKTLLVQSALAPALGDVDSMSAPHSDEEMDKRLTSIMLEARPVVFLDNVDRVMNYASLASALTKPRWSSRVLGVSAMVGEPIQCTFAMTANNPVFSPDIQRRAVPVNLDARMEDPSQRTGFKISLPSWALEHRGELIWAACTVIASWVAAGKPAPPESTPHIGGFGPWRRVMGGILTHANLPGFLENLAARNEDKDPVEDTFEAICKFAVTTFDEGEWWYSRELAEQLISADIELTFGQTFDQLNKKVMTERLGKFLGHRKGRIVDGLRLERAPRDSNGYPWRLVSVEGSQ